VRGLMGKNGRKLLKYAQKRGPEKRARGPPGRGVLRFWDGVYRKPRSYFAFFGLKIKKRRNLGVDVIQGRGTACISSTPVPFISCISGVGVVWCMSGAINYSDIDLY